MQYSVCKKFDIDQMCNLRKSVGWNELKAMMSNPQMENLFSIICTENGKMIGFLNVVSNNVTDAYIQDVMVAPEFQGKGIGTELMNRAISEIKARGIYMISVIYGEEKLRCFYEKFGFCTMLCGQLETSFEQ